MWVVRTLFPYFKLMEGFGESMDTEFGGDIDRIRGSNGIRFGDITNS